MANATAKTVTAKSITLDLNEEEATVVRAVLSQVTGSGNYRNAAQAVYAALGNAGITNVSSDGWASKVKFSPTTTVRITN